MKTYLFSYPYQGHRYSLEIPADSREEAEGRLKAMPWAKYDGELVTKVPVVSGGWLPSVICRIRNLLEKGSG